MPDLTPFFRIARPMRTTPFLATLVVTSFAAAPAAAEDASLPYELIETTDTALAPGIAQGDEQPARYMQSGGGDIDENILLPGARDDDDDDSERKWSRDYIAVAGGVLNSPDYNGSDDRRFLPAFYVRGRYEGFSFSTRGTNFQAT